MQKVSHPVTTTLAQVLNGLLLRTELTPNLDPDPKRKVQSPHSTQKGSGPDICWPPQAYPRPNKMTPTAPTPCFSSSVPTPTPIPVANAAPGMTATLIPHLTNSSSEPLQSLSFPAPRYTHLLSKAPIAVENPILHCSVVFSLPRDPLEGTSPWSLSRGSPDLVQNRHSKMDQLRQLGLTSFVSSLCCWCLAPGACMTLSNR